MLNVLLIWVLEKMENIMVPSVILIEMLNVSFEKQL